MMNTEPTLPKLSAEEIRVLGSLIEKSKTTPDYYPMSLNALTAACNQKTSRYPVVDYTEEEVQKAVNSLKAQSLVANAIGGGSRTQKFKHNFSTVFEVSDEELAVLCLLMLKGVQTPGELNTNSARLVEFRSLDEVHRVLNKLQSSVPPFVVELLKRPGQKETRFAQLLSDMGESNDKEQVEPPVNKSTRAEDRLDKLERELALVKETLDKLVKDLS